MPANKFVSGCPMYPSRPCFLVYVLTSCGNRTRLGWVAGVCRVCDWAMSGSLPSVYRTFIYASQPMKAPFFTFYTAISSWDEHAPLKEIWSVGRRVLHIT